MIQIFVTRILDLIFFLNVLENVTFIKIWQTFFSLSLFPFFQVRKDVSFRHTCWSLFNNIRFWVWYWAFASARQYVCYSNKLFSKQDVNTPLGLAVDFYFRVLCVSTASVDYTDKLIRLSTKSWSITFRYKVLFDSRILLYHLLNVVFHKFAIFLL